MSNVELDDELLDPVNSGFAPPCSSQPLPTPRKVTARSCGGAEQSAGVNSKQESDGQQARQCRARGQVQAALSGARRQVWTVPCRVGGQVWAVSAELGDKMMSRPWAGPQSLGNQGSWL